MSRAPQPLPSEVGSRFVVGDALQAGVSRERLRRADLDAPYAGTRVLAGSELDHLDRARLLSARIGDHAFLSHTTAAIALDIPLPWRVLCDDRPHLSVMAPARAPHAAGLRGHSIEATLFDVIRWHGLRVTRAARTWLDLASTGLSIDDLVIAGDRLLRWTEPLCSLEELARQLREHPGARGARAARAALPLLTDRSQSPRESLVRLQLAAAGLPRPELNYVISAADGMFVARVDLAFPEYKVLVEYEGEHHLRDPLQWAKDIDRFNLLQSLGWICIRVERMNAASVHAQVERALAQRGWRR
ncbi:MULTISPECIES: hypothetical protein [unclassified Leifsonia]|uniref:hypothetical protein n=1 Tax=unclassified Leifsonia TaxID=2663824 RepID=UPI0006FD01F5|nr:MULTISPECIES: hypothetical protein [unclassified Leifsonia]KQX06334.1 hypothetical protein ASC59_00120 [Leifsonia sp. Root1293]KRA10618.1 hypothetical protein ASD61_00120 [Leifsonia sp. Root60]